MGRGFGLVLRTKQYSTPITLIYPSFITVNSSNAITELPLFPDLFAQYCTLLSTDTPFCRLRQRENNDRLVAYASVAEW